MAIFSKPLADRLSRPLGSAVLWGMLAGTVTAVIAFAAGGAGSLIRWGTDGFNDLTWSWNLVRGVAAVGAPLSVVSSTWAASYASTQTAPAGRALVASAVGVVVLIGAVAIEWLSGLFAAAVAAWGLAIPFERWTRFAARLVVPVAVVAVTPLFLATMSWWAIALSVVVSYPAAAAAIASGEAGWKMVQGRKS